MSDHEPPDDPPDDEGVYDGPASIRVGDLERTSRVRLTGQFQPIDGRYHWQGMVFDSLEGLVAKVPQQVEVVIDGNCAVGRLTEATPWKTWSVVGVGAPPF